MQIYFAAYVIYSKYKSSETRAEGLDDPAAISALWQQTHTECASIAAWHARSLLGLWIKLGQFMASRADVRTASVLMFVVEED